MARKAIASGLLVGLAMCAPQGVVAQNGALFVEADSTMQAMGRDDRDARSIRYRMVTVDASRLSEVRGDVERTGESTLTLNLFDDVVLSAVVDQTAQTSTGYSLAGWIQGAALGSLTLVVNLAAIAGTVRIPEATYTIRTVGSGILAVREIDSMSMAPEEPLPSPIPPPSNRMLPIVPPSQEAPSAGSGSPVLSAVGSDDGSRIDVMVVYTAGAREDAGGVEAIQAEIDLRVAETNQAFANSGVIPRIHLVWTAEVDYMEVPRDDTNSRQTNTIDHLREAVGWLHGRSSRLARPVRGGPRALDRGSAIHVVR